MAFLKNININFVDKTKYAFMISGILIVSGIISLIYKGGPSLSIDFTGGHQIQITKYIDSNNNGKWDDDEEPYEINIADVRNEFIKENIKDIEIKIIGAPHTIAITIPPLKPSLTDENPYIYIHRILKKVISAYNEEASEAIGPKIGSELKSDAFKAIGIALILITIYISFRFDRFYAYGSLAALVHDMLITLGIFSILDIPLSLKIVAAFLTILGYSLNDTIVVFDRLRETKDKYSGDPIDDIINKSLNATLNRTIITSFTTLLAVTTLFVFGGSVLKDFAFALIIGVIVGTYSSVFIASPVMKYFEIRKKDTEEYLEEGV